LLQDLLLVSEDGKELSVADISPQKIVDILTRYSYNLTKSSREFMETHPNTRLPPDLLKYPGKMVCFLNFDGNGQDHSTAMCFRVGKKPLSKIKRVDSGINKEKHRTSSF
jgi:hypothetical protein